MKDLAQLFTAACLVLVQATHAHAQIPKVETEIQAIMQEAPAVGFSVAVVKGNRIVYTGAFGMKSREKNLPMTVDCLFRIASISKSFSATSIMQLAEAGKLSLDQDVGDLIGFKVRNPRFPEKIITLRMLLSHLSSINDSQGYFSLDAINPEKNPGWEKCYSEYEPGSSFRYCNLNYNMIGTIIERVSGQRFDQYVKNHVLDPLGLYGGYDVYSLDTSRFASLYEYNTDAASFSLSPAAYSPRPEILNNYTMGYSTPVFSPTGGMKITAEDLAKYMIMHSKMGRYRGKRIITKKSAAQLQTPASDESGYGFALEKTQKMIPGKTMVGHTGSAYGLYSAMYFHPRGKFGIVVFTNGCNSSYSEGYNMVLRRVLNCLYTNIIRQEG